MQAKGNAVAAIERANSAVAESGSISVPGECALSNALLY